MPTTFDNSDDRPKYNKTYLKSVVSFSPHYRNNVDGMAVWSDEENNVTQYIVRVWWILEKKYVLLM